MSIAVGVRKRIRITVQTNQKQFINPIQSFTPGSASQLRVLHYFFTDFSGSDYPYFHVSLWLIEDVHPLPRLVLYVGGNRRVGRSRRDNDSVPCFAYGFTAAGTGSTAVVDLVGDIVELVKLVGVTGDDGDSYPVVVAVSYVFHRTAYERPVRVGIGTVWYDRGHGYRRAIRIAGLYYLIRRVVVDGGVSVVYRCGSGAVAVGVVVVGRNGGIVVSGSGIIVGRHSIRRGGVHRRGISGHRVRGYRRVVIGRIRNHDGIVVAVIVVPFHFIAVLVVVVRRRGTDEKCAADKQGGEQGRSEGAHKRKG